MISDTISDIIGDMISDMISDIVPDKDKGEAAVTGSVFRFYSGLTTDCVYFFEATSEHLS